MAAITPGVYDLFMAVLEVNQAVITANQVDRDDIEAVVGAGANAISAYMQVLFEMVHLFDDDGCNAATSMISEAMQGALLGDDNLAYEHLKTQHSIISAWRAFGEVTIRMVQRGNDIYHNEPDPS